MMQANEVRQKVQHLEQTISRAAQACQSDNSVPEELKQCVSELDQQAQQAEQMLQGNADENQIRQCIDDLEAISDRARNACQQGSNVQPEISEAVMQAHSELSQLKHQLH
jgi:uncharacterized coiled-coil DUF342 family protein